MALWLKQSTAETVTVGPALSISDGVTPVTTLASGTVDEIGVYKEDGTALVDLSGLTLTHRAGGVYTFPLSTASTDTVGRLYLYIRDDSACLPIWHEFMVLDPEAYDAIVSGNAFGTDDKMLISTDAQDLSATLDVNTKTLTAGAVTAAAIATGAIDADAIATDAITAAKIAADAIGSSELATTAVDEIVDGVWDEALSGHNTGGSAGKALRNAGGIVLDTGTADAGAANTIDLETGANTNDDFYNHTVIIITAGTGAGQERLITDYVGSTQQATVTPAWVSGLEPDATSEYEIIPGTSHAETQGGGYADGAVWIGPSGSTGTQLYVDGTVDNPIDDGQMANAKTVADALNLKIFRVEPGSSVTLGAAFDNYEFRGYGYSLALGGQSVNGSLFEGATISGNDDGSNTTATLYRNCTLSDSTLGLHKMEGCGLGGTTTGITLAEAGTYDWDQCYSQVAGTGTPKVTFGVGNQNLNMRHWSGGVQIENMGASASTDNMSIEGHGQVVEGTCTAGTVAIRGAFTISGITNLTLSDDARIDVAQINAEVDTALNTTTYSEPGAGAPTATPTIREMLHYLYKNWRNKKTQTSSTWSLFDDAGSTADQNATVSDAAGTTTKGEVGA